MEKTVIVTTSRVPHARGDEPRLRDARGMTQDVFPTPVGMNRFAGYT